MITDIIQWVWLAALTAGSLSQLRLNSALMRADRAQLNVNFALMSADRSQRMLIDELIKSGSCPGRDDQ